jgi:protoporphyrinogen/coproporphyrinogen III oxidase
LTKFDAIIIGAGISGLVAAHRLQTMRRRVLLLESGDRIGGVIQSLDAEGFLIEQGPNSLRGTHELLDLVEELDLMAELVTADPRAPAYVYFNRELHAVPMGPPALIKTKLLSGGAKLRLLREPFIHRRTAPGEESIASFVRRRLGPEILDRMVAPFLSGVYAGAPDALSVQACFPRLAEFEAEAGSVIRGGVRAMRAAKKEAGEPKRSLRPYRLCSFRGGLKTLTQTLARSLGESLQTQARVVKIERNEFYEIGYEQDGRRLTVASPALIIAAPADAAARLLGETAPDIASLLSEIEYVSIASVPLAYRVKQLSRPLDGFGFLAPRSEGLRTLGSIWNSALFTDRSPEGWTFTTNFIGGATDPEAVRLSDEALIETVHRDLNQALGITGAPRRLPITRYERAIPQYNLGHAARVTAIDSLLKHHRGLRLAGNYLHGVSLGDCIKNADAIAHEINQAL